MSVVSLALAKQQLGVEYDNQDLKIQADIDGAEEWLENAIGKKFSAEDVTEYVEGGGFALWPSRCPVNSVTSVTDTESGSAESADDWHLRKNGIYRDSAARWDRGRVNRWQVVYNGGYTSVPAGIVSIIIDLLSRAYNPRGGKEVQSAAGYGTEWELFVDTLMWQRINDYATARSRFG
jgi:hypothetical protein